MNIRGIVDNEEITKIDNKQNVTNELNISLPNNKSDLTNSKKLNSEREQILRKVSEPESDNENTISINILNSKPNKPKFLSLDIRSNSKKKLEFQGNSDNSNSKKSKDNTNFVETKKNSYEENKTNSNKNNPNINNQGKNYLNFDYDFLSLSDIDFESEKDFQFLGFMAKKKLMLSSTLLARSFYSFNSNAEEIFYINGGKRIKSRLFIEENKLSIFNSSTNFSLQNSKYFPIVNLDFDFITAEMILNIESLSFRIVVLCSEKHFSFYIPDKTVYLSITKKINIIIKNSRGYKVNLVSIPLRKEFYKV